MHEYERWSERNRNTENSQEACQLSGQDKHLALYAALFGDCIPLLPNQDYNTNILSAICSPKPLTERSNPMSDDTKQEAPAPSSWDATQWHEVVKGDTLSKIAAKYYGDASLYPQIFEANKDILTDPDKIKIGQKLRIP